MSIETKLQKVAWIEHLVPSLEHGTLPNKLVQHQVMKALNKGALLVTQDKKIVDDTVNATPQPIDGFVDSVETTSAPVVNHTIKSVKKDAKSTIKALDSELNNYALRKDIGI